MKTLIQSSLIVFLFLFIQPSLFAQFTPPDNGPRSIELSRDFLDISEPNHFALVLSGSNFAAKEDVTLRLKLLATGQVMQENSVKTDANGNFRLEDFRITANRGGLYRMEATTSDNPFPASDEIFLALPQNSVFIDDDSQRWDGILKAGKGSSIRVNSRGYQPNRDYTLTLFALRSNGSRFVFASGNGRSNNQGNWSAELVVPEQASPETGYLLDTDGGESANVAIDLSIGPLAHRQDIHIAGIEVTQGLQRIDNSITLVRGKDTWVRVYVLGKHQQISDVRCYLWGERDGQILYTPHVFDGNAQLTNALPANNPDANGDWSRGTQYWKDVVPNNLDLARNDLNQSFNFRIPNRWIHEAGEITFRAMAVHRHDPNPADNTREVTVNLLPSRKLHYALARVQATGHTTPSFNVREETRGHNYLLNAFPVGRQDLIRSHYDRILAVGDYGGELWGGLGRLVVDENENLDTDWEWHKLMITLEFIRARLDFGDARELGILYGMIPNSVRGTDHAGLANGPCTPFLSWPVACGKWSMPDPVQIARDSGNVSLHWQRPERAATMAHEMGHVMGLFHIGLNENCGFTFSDIINPMGFPNQIGGRRPEQALGFSTHSQFPAIIPSNTSCLMRRGSARNRWIGDHSYEHIFRTLNPCGPGVDRIEAYYSCHSGKIFKTYAAALRDSQTGSSPHQTSRSPVRMIVCDFPGESQDFPEGLDCNNMPRRRAFIGRAENGECAMSGWEMIEEYNPDQAQQLQSQQTQLSNLRIQVEDKSGAIVYQGFVQALDFGLPGVKELYSVLLPPLEKAHLVKIVDQSSKKTLLKEVLPQSLPKGTVDARFGNGLLYVDYTSEHPEGKPLSRSFQYSPDGVSWYWLDMAKDAKGTLKIDAKDFPGGSRAKVRMHLSDGYHHETVVSKSLVMPDQKPVIQVRIDPGGKAPDSRVPLFAITADDPEDGPLPDQSVLWSSNLQGTLGHGWELQDRLKKGSHVITVTATDSGGNKAKKTFSIKVD